MINKAKSWSFEKIYKVNKTLVKLMRSERMQHKGTIAEMEKTGSTTYPDLQKIRLYASGLEKEGNGHIAEIYNFPNLIKTKND